jgi:MFS family permease
LSKVTKGSFAVLAACTITHFIIHIHIGALSPFLPIIKNELSLTLTEAGFVASITVFTMTVTHILVGYLGDKGIREKFIQITIILSSIIMLLSSLITSFLSLAICMALLGIAASGYHPSGLPKLAEWFPSKKRAHAAGIQSMGGVFGAAIIPLVGVILIGILGGWRESFLFLGITGIIIFIPVVALMRYSGNITVISEEYSSVIGGADGWTKTFVISLGIKGIRSMTFQCISLLMPLYLVEAYGFEPLWAGSLASIMLIAGLFGEIFTMYLSDKIHRRVPFIIASTGFVAPCLLLLNYSLMGFYLILILILIGFFFFSGVPPLMAWLSEVSPKQSQGLAFGILFSIGAIPGALSPFFFGVIGDVYGLEMSILFLVITATLSTVLALFLNESKIKKQDI